MSRVLVRWLVLLLVALNACGNNAGAPDPTIDAGTLPDGASDGDMSPDGEAGVVFVCARPLDSATATLFYDAARCLFEGSEAPQRGVAANTIEPERVAIVRGRALDREGKAVAGVQISVSQHAE